MGWVLVSERELNRIEVLSQISQGRRPDLCQRLCRGAAGYLGLQIGARQWPLGPLARPPAPLSAWLGLTPQPHSSGGKARLGRISKQGNRDLRRLLYLGAIAQVSAPHAGGLRAAWRRGQPGDDWLWQIIGRKTPKQAAIALANRTARMIYALRRDGPECNATKAS